MRRYGLLILLLTCVLSHRTWAATRLGFHVTSEELAIWQARMTDNVNTMNGFTFQSIYTNRIKARADAFVASPTEGTWAGNTTGSCQPNTSPADFSFGPGRGSAHNMATSAFVFLLTGNTSYASGVLSNLLSMAGNANLNFTNTSKWCTPSYQNTVEIQPWSVRMFLAYDYLKAGNYSAMTAGNRTTIETWLTGLGNWWFVNFRTFSMSNFYSYNLFSNPLNTTCLSNCTASLSPWYYTGHNTAQASENIFNTAGAGNIYFGALVGVLTNNATHLADVKRWITGFVPTAINHVGAVAQVRRWQDVACSPTCGVGSAWGHAGGETGALVGAIDVIARFNGDTSPYDLTAATQVPGSPAGTVSMFGHVRKWARMANHTESLYSYGSGGAQNTEITWNTDTNGNYYDLPLMAANIYYNNSEISAAMNRTALGSNSSLQSGGGCFDSQFGGCHSGANAAWWPDVPFMAGKLNGVINPYNLTATSAAPTVAIQTPTTLPAYGTGTTPITVGGVASDDVGVTGVTWTCPTCSTTSGTATCTPTCGASATSVSWSIGTLGFPSAGTYTLTVTAMDGDSQTATDTLTIVYNTTPPDVTTALELWYGFEEASGNALDSSGHGHTGTLTGGAARTTGKVDASALSLNGTTAYVSTAGLLTTPAAITVAAWVKLSALPTAWVDVVSLGDTIVLRAAPGEMRGVYSAGSSTWNNTVGAVAWDTTTWRHMAFVAQAGAQAVYLDGVPLAQTSTSAAIVYSGLGANTVLGTHGNPAGTTNFVAGAVDDVRVYTRFLAPRDIVALAAQEAPPDITSNKVLHLMFDDGASPTDDSGSGNQDATLSAGTTFVTGKIGALAVRFTDNSGHLVTVPGSIAYATTGAPFTVALWTNLSSFPLALDYPMPLQLRSNGSLTFEIDYSNDVANSCLGVSFGNTGGGFTPLRYVVAAAADLLGWHHLAIVYNGTGATTAANYTLYWDGVAKTITTALCPAGKAQATTLGGYSGATQNGDWQGDLDDVYVYARALTQAEVAALMALPGPSAPVAGSAFRLLR